MPDSENALYYGDNLRILKNHLIDESVDLIYLDPPFNSKADYNILFKEQSGEPSQGQIKAFSDTWQWSEGAYIEFINECQNEKLCSLLEGFVNTIGRNDVTAYLTMMAPRLQELHRVLKPTGSLYLHCDPAASHYLKLILDCVFSPINFRNEIIWRRTNAKSLAFTNFAKNHDIIFRYSKSNKWIWNPQYLPHDEEYVRKFYKYSDEHGRKYRLSDLTNPNKNRPNLTYEFLGVTRVWRWTKKRMQQSYEKGVIVQKKPGSVPQFKRFLDEQSGNPIDDIWSDVRPVQANAAERLGYPTQKPLGLLERIISSSSKEGDVVLDPFCGCGTAIASAQKLKRNWIGIDITHLAVSLIQARLRDMYAIVSGTDYHIEGVPETESAARVLAQQDRFEFQKWAVSLVPNVYPLEGKGADEGIDGRGSFPEITDQQKIARRKIVIQVKSGKITLSAIRDFGHVIEREKAALGFFITLEKPTAKMSIEANKMGFFTSHLFQSQKIPRYQIRTIQDLFSGLQFELPPTLGMGIEGVKRAQRAVSKSEQPEIDFTDPN